jgi:malate/lactate dehydrogenase
MLGPPLDEILACWWSTVRNRRAPVGWQSVQGRVARWLLDGEYGITDVCLSLPTILDRSGVHAVLTPPVSEPEIASLRHYADAVRGVARSLRL